jgi:predicted DCC family thiol-disulfide oxidoreductase YuxK
MIRIINEIPDKPVVLFDSICGLCSAAIHFIIRHDSQKIFRFACLQSSFAHKLESDNLHGQLPGDSIILFFNGELYYRSQAIFLIARLLGGPFNLASILRIIPVFILDSFYDFIASHRYRWLGKSQTCMMPDSNISDRFLN